MRNSRGFTSLAALGCLLVAAFLMPALVSAQEFPVLDSTQKTAAPSAEPYRAPEGFNSQGRQTTMFLVDGANGGTIYFYNYEMEQIIRTCPTPEPADGVTADGLAYALDRASLFYTNANGTGLIYELDAQDCSVLQTFDSAVACGGCGAVPGLAYGDIAAGGVNGIWMLGITPEGGTGNRGSLPDGSGPIAGFNWSTPGFALGSIGADPDGNGWIYIQDYYPDIDIYDAVNPAFIDYWDTYENEPYGGIGMVSRRDSAVNPTSRDEREYHSTLAPDDTLYEYSAVSAYPTGVGRAALSSRTDPTPGDQISAVGVGDLDTDWDGFTDLGDVCPLLASPNQDDGDTDGVGDECDNCVDTPNPDQADRDLDGLGDACDAIYSPPPLPDKVLYINDATDGGTIFEYDPASGTILREFPTPEANLGLGQGLAYSRVRGALYYINATGSALLYELSLEDGSVVRFNTWPYAEIAQGLGIGFLGNFPAAGANIQETWGYASGVDPSTGQGRFAWWNPNTLSSFVSTGLDCQNQCGTAGNEDLTDEAAATGGIVDGIGYFTEPFGDGTQEMGAVSANPFAFVGSREWVITSDADQIALAADGDTFYMSRAGVDGIFTYNIYDYFSTAVYPQNLVCVGGNNDGADCHGSIAQTGCDPVADPLCCDGGSCESNAPFISDPTPGGPITALAAGEADVDHDGVRNSADNCSTIPNPQQTDSDSDGLGDACDNCPNVANPGQEESELLDKFDGIGDVCDNCPFLFNPDQTDSNGNGVGDVCDPPPGFVDDSDADDDTFGPDNPPVPRAYDIASFETSVDLCDFSCVGGADVCCGQAFGDGEPAMIIEITALGAETAPKLTSGFYDVYFDYGEGDSCTGLSIKDAETEPGVCEDTSDIRMSARFAQSTGRSRIEPNWQANLQLNPILEQLSSVNQSEGTISFVLPVSTLIDKADAAQQAASGLDTDPPGGVEFALWGVVGGNAQNNDDRVPNTNDNLTPTIRDEVTVFTAYFNQVDIDYPGSPGPLTFDGSTPCQFGDGDRVVVGTGSATAFMELINPSFQPMTITDFIVDDPQFSVPVSLPLTIGELGGSLGIGVAFEPAGLGPQMANVTPVSSDPTPVTIQLTGTGLPNDPPVVTGCDINPDSIFLGQRPIITLDASDSATLANITGCTAVGTRQGIVRTVVFGMNDDGSALGDLACDGTFTASPPSGGLFGRGTWDFEFSCQDKQGNVTALAGGCQLVIN
ncbi:MAG: thrombospondin type 3 repeat-containing protein [Acidobacteriota bacterium]|jgi:hypothetical protein